MRNEQEICVMFFGKPAGFDIHAAFCLWGTSNNCGSCYCGAQY
jgi:hypothetical protein